MNNNFLSLCIPRVFLNIDEKRIRRIFDELDIGEIQRIDIVNKTTEKGEKYNRVFVHFKRWFDTENANLVRERLLEGKEIKIIYEDPWFWKVSAYREPNKSHRKTPMRQPKMEVHVKKCESDLKKLLGIKGSPIQNINDETPGQRILRAINHQSIINQ
jgi:hypothetical protein